MPIRKLIRKFKPLLTDLLREGNVHGLPLLPGSALALLAWGVNHEFNRTVVCVSGGAQDHEQFHGDLRCLNQGPASGLLYYPALDDIPSPGGKGFRQDPDMAACRMSVLHYLSFYADPAGKRKKQSFVPPVISTCVRALLQETERPGALSSSCLDFTVNNEMELTEIPERLAGMGFRIEHEVAEKGTASIRGGILDVWPITEEQPVRVEFHGTGIESIRTFDPETQRSVEKKQSILIFPAHESSDPAVGGGRACLLDHLPPDTVFIWSDFDSIREHAELCEEVSGSKRSGREYLSLNEIRSRIEKRPAASQVISGTVLPEGVPSFDLPDIRPVQGVADIPREALQPDVLDAARQTLLSDLLSRAGRKQTVLLFFDSPGALEHFRQQQPAYAGLESVVGVLSGGFVSDGLKLNLIAGSDLYGRRRAVERRYVPGARKSRMDLATGSRIAELTDIEPGDLVVHLEHGIGKYLGLYEIIFNGQRQEVLTIEYAEKTKLHVPVSHAHLLSRYVGAGRHRATLHRLGGKRWSQDKLAAERSIQDLAASLLETQAQRKLLDGFAFPDDCPWQHEFESSFPYHETPDQQRVIEEVKKDMLSTRPMDRLVCGDAGYGKTEVAMRAAFRTVMSHKQVAMLVPTTVLAQQHYMTFRERMAAYPVRVEMLSRFCGPARHADVLKGLGEGSVDIVIGTHSLLQPGVRFKDLGLVIIDEEQRFGVTHKEYFKQMRRLVDVLTLTATPIPRTLHLSLTGARDMSLLQTPPRERTAIETIVTKNTDEVVREAILREINRDGQVFYLHNRVMTIAYVQQRLQQMVPEARIETAHGQMGSSDLASVMRRFIAGDFNVLLCTTIIESGMDIPRANTILIDRADRFGLADLYQLRGRVGRSPRKAYAYMLLPSHGAVDADARKRIGAIKKYSSLGAGFSLALRDLEIRGAGNILGAAQSGHIAAIGFGLYCQLLQRTVAGLKGDPLPPIVDVGVSLDFLDYSSDSDRPDHMAILPYTYIEEESLRIAAYRRMAETSRLEDLRDLREEFRDRYGPIPDPVQRLLRLTELRVLCSQQGIRKVEVREGKVLFTRGGDLLMKGKRLPRLLSKDADALLNELIALAQSADDWSGAE